MWALVQDQQRQKEKAERALRAKERLMEEAGDIGRKFGKTDLLEGKAVRVGCCHAEWLWGR